MHLPDEFRLWIIDFVSNNTFQQIAPLIVLLLVPTLTFLAASTIRRRSSATLGILLTFAYTITMSIALPVRSWFSWPFSSPASIASTHGSSRDSREKKKSKKHHVRTRSEQLLLVNGSAKTNGSIKAENEEGYYSGLVNISGTYCFMNSTLQALASLSYLQPHIDAIQAKAEALDVPTPVVDALKELFNELNTPHSSYRAIRPLDIIEVLTNQTQGRPTSLFNSREHQDAQELFQVVSECIKNESLAVDKEGARDRGFGALAEKSEVSKDIGKSVFDGLTANRRSCVFCGYTEAVMHFAFDSWQLSVPRLAATCRLEDCLEDYTRLEILKDCICRKCSLVATHSRLQRELEALQEVARPSNSKKRRLKEVKKMEARVNEALQQGRIEDDLKDVRMEKVFSTASTKQAMIARPPPVLALHLNRSIHFGQYAAKNNCKVVFPEVLDLTPYTTSGSLSTIPTAAISSPPPALPRSTTPTPSIYGTARTTYRLSAVVCHYGSHSFGHYICYRRKPRHLSVGRDRRFLPPKLIDPMSSSSGSVVDPEYLWEDGEPGPGTGWLRISDDAVGECGIETVLTEGTGAFMLYYELAVRDGQGVYPSLVGSMRASEETLRPEVKTVDLNGSVGSLVSEVGVGIQSRPHVRSERLSVSMSVSQQQPRVVRSVAAGRGRSVSAQPVEKRVSQLNGSTVQVSEPDFSKVMGASAPSLVKTKSPKKSLPPKTPLSAEPAIASPHPVHPPVR